MRNRAGQANGEKSESSAPGKSMVATHLKRFDVYTKVHDDYSVSTRSGGALSLGAIVTMIVLFISELDSHLTADISDHIVVDTTLNQKLQIMLDITFPHLRCDEISVDSVDSMGENQVDIAGTLTKVNLDAQGQQSKGDFVPKEGECLTCMEAREYVGADQCCNSCRELKDAYQEAGLPYFHILDTALQCRDSVGCQIVGDVRVAKVGGNVHVALGKSTVHEGKHVHEFDIKDVSDGFNTSHQITKLAFGEMVHGMESPLEGVTKTVKHGAYMFHYYIKLVPTLFTVDDRVVYTHQYSVTDNEKNVLVKKGELAGLPGVFLVYEFSPFMVQKIEKFKPLSHFVTSVCAIIGGVFTVAGLIDAALWKGYSAVRRKPEAAGK